MSLSLSSLYLCLSLIGLSLSDENEVNLHRFLFDKPPYHYMARPVKTSSSKIWTNFSISVSQIVNIDMRNEVVTLSVWPTQEWYDEYMVWSPLDFGGIARTGISPDNIWKPEIVLYNNVDGRFEVEFKSRVLIGYNGNCLWAPPSIFKTYCKINAHYFPYDEQFCPITFLSFGYDYTELEIVSKFEEGDYTGDQYWESSEWTLLSAKSSTYLTTCPTCMTNKHSAITFMLHLKRKPLFYTVNLVLPILYVSILTVMSFYLPSECCEKITLTVTVLLSVTMLLLIVSKMVPKTSYHVPILNMYLIFILLLVSFSLIGNVVVLNIHFRTSGSHHQMSSLPRNFILNVLPKFVFMDSFTATELWNMTDQKSPELAKYTHSSYHKEIARRLERWHLQRSSMEEINWPRHRMLRDRNKPKLTCLHEEEPGEIYSELNVGYAAVNESLKYIEQYMEGNSEEQRVTEEWKFLALVMDRFLLIIFALITVVGSYIIIFSKFYLYTGN